MKTLDRQIAARASALVQGRKGKPSAAQYLAISEEMPTMLRTAGLAQSLAFLKAKRNVHGEVYTHLQQHFRELKFLGENQDLLDQVINPQALPASGYRTYTRVAHRIAYWHRRLAQAILKPAEEQRQGQNSQAEAAQEPVQ